MSHPKKGERLDVVYGIHSVREAVRTRPVDFVMITQGYHNPRLQEIIDACRAAGIGLRFSPRPAVERAAGTPQHQNVVAVCTPKAYDDISDLVAQAERPLLVALDGVEDPANLGAIIRTVVATGARGVIIPERRAAGLSPAVARRICRFELIQLNSSSNQPQRFRCATDGPRLAGIENQTNRAAAKRLWIERVART